MLNGLDLFSGIGGISYALREYIQPIAYCEIDPYCQAVLLNQMANKRIAHSPIWDDIRSLKGGDLPLDTIDIIYGGFPCQDISIAGHGKGLAGERSRLFFEIVRLAKEIKPKFIFLENVGAILSRGGIRCVREITEMGYDCRWCVISAASIGAPHKRERWFLLAHPKHHGSFASEIDRSPAEGISDSQEGQNSALQFKGMDSPRNVAYSKNSRKGQPLPGEERQSELGLENQRSYWQTVERPVCGVDDGISNRVDRIRALGNAVVPEQAKKAFEILMGII